MHEPTAIDFRAAPTGRVSFQQLARALVDAGHDVPRILDALRQALSPALCDHCSIEVSANSNTGPQLPLGVGARHAVLGIPSQGLLHGSVTVTRDTTRAAFDARDLGDIETCIEYASLAAEVSLELEAGRTALRASLER